MAIKTFTTGEVLTASDTNTYLANSGLVFVKSQTVGSGVAEVIVTDAFSATYDNYKVIYTNGVGSTIAILTMRLGNTNTGYSNAGMVVPYSGATSASQTNNGAAWSPIGVMASDYANVNLEIFSPFLSRKTFISWDYLYASGEYIRFGGFLNNSTSYTAFTIFCGAGTLTGGQVTVYGYRKG
jgi:hypothetical protein